MSRKTCRHYRPIRRKHWTPNHLSETNYWSVADNAGVCSRSPPAPVGFAGEQSDKPWKFHFEQLVADAEAPTFDIAIIGAGSCGPPMTDDIGKNGEQAIHPEVNVMRQLESEGKSGRT